MSRSAKLLLFLSLPTLLYACSTREKKPVSEIEVLMDSLSHMVMISSSDLVPATQISINGSNFELAMQGSDTLYLGTRDKSFQTPEGYSVGLKLAELPITIQQNLQKEPEFLYYYKLPSGWTLGFCYGDSCTDSYPPEDSKVAMIFKRK